MYLSKLYPGEVIIDDNNQQLYAPASTVVINGEVLRRGLILPTDEEKFEFRAAAQGYARAFDVPTMSREEIRERIKEREQRGATLSQIVRKKKIPTSNQDSTNFCWCYGVVTAINIMRAHRNMPYVEFSRESVCAPIKSYRNNGGWGDQALAYIVQNGIMPQDLWPRYYYSNSKYNTSENLAVAAKNKVTEFLILQDRNFLQAMTALCLDYPIAVGYNWWSHEVCAIDPVIIGSSDIGIRIWNSWGDSYGAQGMAILAESKATADDQVIPVVQNIQ